MEMDRPVGPAVVAPFRIEKNLFYGFKFTTSCSSGTFSTYCSNFAHTPASVDEELLKYDSDILKVLEDGQAYLRLYGTKSDVAASRFYLFNDVLGDQADSDRVIDETTWDNDDVVPALITGTSITKIGWREEVKTVTLMWRGESSKELGYATATKTELVFKSRVYNADGEPVGAPARVPGNPGKIAHDEPVWGSMVVRVAVEYCLFRVDYGLGVTGDALQQMKKAWVYAASRKPAPILPSLRIVASTDSKAVEMVIPRQIYPDGAASTYRGTGPAEYNPTTYAANALARTGFSQTNFSSQTKRITADNDPNVFLDFEVPVAIDFITQDGDTMTLRFPTS